MSYLLKFFIILSILATNPWSHTDYGQWILPRLIVLFITLVYVGVIVVEKSYQFYSKTWLYWLAFLSWGGICTVLSKFPNLSFFGIGYWGDGWLYWLLCGGLYVLLETCIHNDPSTWRSLDEAVKFGAIVASLAVFFPFYARAGHAAYVIGLGMCLLGLDGIYTGIGSVTLLFLGNRAVILALLCAFWPQLWRRFKGVIGVALVALLLFSGGRSIRPGKAPIQNQVLRNITSDRINLVTLIHSPDIHPLLGKGFNGLAILKLEKPDQRSWITSAKLHNLVADTYLSLGIPGLLLYGLLLVQILKPLPLPLVVYYLIFMMLWYDNAQYTHLILFLSLNYRNGLAYRGS